MDLPAGSRVCLLILVLTWTSIGAAPSALAGAAEPVEPVEVIVVFKDARNATAITSVGGTVTGGRDVGIISVLFVRLPERAIEPLERHEDVALVERDRETDIVGQRTPWGLTRINATAAASRVDDDAESNVTVAVLDTGVDHDHEDLAGSVAWGVNTVGEGAIRYGTVEADDVNGHGTHVAGTIAADDNGVGVVGVAPNAQLYAVKVMADDGTGTYSDLIEGISEAIKGPDGTKGTTDDADVITMSLGGNTDSAALEAAIEEASQYTVLVAAAGNTGDGDPMTNDVLYPARYEEVIAVGAVNEDNQVPTWSSDGKEIEIVAPGVRIDSTYPGNRYAQRSGTSMAAPHVAGTITLLIARDLSDGVRNWSTATIRRRLYDAAIDIGPPGRDNETGYGIVQADNVVGSEPVALNVTANETTVPTGSNIRFTVTRIDTGERVNATITVNGTGYVTNGDGTTVIRFGTPGVFTTTASKPPADFERFTDDSVTVSVKRREVPLNLVTNATNVTTGQSIAFYVSRSDTGAPVKATVRIAGVALRTGADGRATYTFQSAGTYTATASEPNTTSERFLNDSAIVTVTGLKEPEDVTGNGLPARDPDGDGSYEDVDGNGETGFDDAVKLAFLAEELPTDQERFFDFDGDGDVDFDDAVELTFEVRV